MEIFLSFDKQHHFFVLFVVAMSILQEKDKDADKGLGLCSVFG